MLIVIRLKKLIRTVWRSRRYHNRKKSKKREFLKSV